MHYLPEEEIFVKKILNNKEQINKNQKIILLKFLDTRKQEIIKNIFKDQRENILFYGGFENAEYKRCIFSPFKIKEENLNIVIFKIIYNKKYLNITHRNVLGNLMSLGIKRESVGDIIINNNECYFACCREIESFILDEFKTFNNMPITLEKMNNIDIKQDELYKEDTILVSSLRLDSILSKIFNYSRNESKEMILNKYIKVNHNVIQNISLTLKEDDLLSVTKKGRFKIIKVLSVTSKGKIKVLIGKKI